MNLGNTDSLFYTFDEQEETRIEIPKNKPKKIS